jgi:hypothetical protein
MAARLEGRYKAVNQKILVKMMEFLAVLGLSEYTIGAPEDCGF